MGTAIRQYVNKALGGMTEPTEIAMDAGLGIGVGAGLGLICGQRKGGLDAGSSGNVPLDISAGAIGMLVTAFAPLKSSTREMVRTASSNALAIGTFRKVEKWSTSKKGATAAGEFGSNEDPIVRAARNL